MSVWGKVVGPLLSSLLKFFPDAQGVLGPLVSSLLKPFPDAQGIWDLGCCCLFSSLSSMGTGIDVQTVLGFKPKDLDSRGSLVINQLLCDFKQNVASSFCFLPKIFANFFVSSRNTSEAWT